MFKIGCENEVKTVSHPDAILYLAKGYGENTELRVRLETDDNDSYNWILRINQKGELHLAVSIAGKYGLRIDDDGRLIVS